MHSKSWNLLKQNEALFWKGYAPLVVATVLVSVSKPNGLPGMCQHFPSLCVGLLGS